MTTSIAVVQ